MYYFLGLLKLKSKTNQHIIKYKYDSSNRLPFFILGRGIVVVLRATKIVGYECVLQLLEYTLCEKLERKPSF